MKILYTIPGLGVNRGGVGQCVFYTVKGLRQYNIDASILTYQPDEGDCFVADESFIIQMPKTESRFAYSSSFRKFLEKHPYDIYHAQAVWQYPTYITAKTAFHNNKPYIITPHGMLYPQAFQKSKLLKKIMLTLSLKKDLNNAAAVHVTCMEEMQHLRNLGVKSPVAVIPNPIYIESEYNHAFPVKDKLRVGYLGRVHPRKNIDRLIHAWANLGKKVSGMELVIIGAGDDTYHQFLKDEVKRLNLNNVVFTGFLTGFEKEKAVESLSYLVVPSDFENFGMIVPEALIKGIPVIASKGTPWEELNTRHCGWWIDNDENSLTTTIDTAIKIPEEERIKMGEHGKNLVKENYSIDSVAKRMIQLYEWILNDEKKPEFVF